MRSTSDWEVIFGEQFRALRIKNDMDQSALAAAANLSVGAIKNLENGRGSSLKTLILALRAMDEEKWLETLCPPDTFSPLKMARDQNISGARQRVFRNRLRIKHLFT